MSEINKTYRIRTEVGSDTNLSINLEQDYDVFEILSLKLTQKDVYKLHNSNYGVVVGRVLANEGFGVPNAKISVFIEGDYSGDNFDIATIYPYDTTYSNNGDGVRYNLLPDTQVSDCHQIVGTFPNKTYVLDNDVLIEVFDKYYKYTTRTNNSGDYLICGVPVGSQTIHMDLDLSDCGILSQRPRDFVYKGYTIEQFENPNQFKTGTDFGSLSQVFSQDKVVNVVPFWGNADLGETIGITRADINISFKFEPTCVFIGSVVGDNASNGISKKCVPTNMMGRMDELMTGEGTIEMIRKTPGGDVEEFQIKGTQLIDGNGVWCYQIPMNLDYMMTDEYGNMVPTDDPSKGIPTRTRVRFRISMQDNEENTDNYFRAKVLVPHNPQNSEKYIEGHEPYDYEFGTNTKEESYRDLFWNNVYTVKSYIPRFQKSKRHKSERFTGIKGCNHYGQNNPMPYNNIRVRLPFMFTLLCILIKTYIKIVGFANTVISAIGNTYANLGDFGIPYWFTIKNWKISLKKIYPFEQMYERATQFKMVVLTDGLCPDLEGWYFSPISPNTLWVPSKKPPGGFPKYNILKQTFDYLVSDQNNANDNTVDTTSTDYANKNDDNGVCLTINIDYLISCIEMNLAQEYRVINFDFYNDWVNGVIYMPRWMRIAKKKRTFLFGLIKIRPKIKACMDDPSVFGKTRYYTQQCALDYSKSNKKYTKITTTAGCAKSNRSKRQICHKANGKKMYGVFGSGASKSSAGNGGVVHEAITSLKQSVYYFKPCEWNDADNKKVMLFANDIVLLGSLNECNLYGIPQAFKYLTNSSYIMPTNLALTNMDDDSYLYSDGEGTMCTAGNNRSINEWNNSSGDYPVNSAGKGRLEQLPVSYSATQKYVSTSIDESFEYGDMGISESYNYDDVVPLTEAAGIAWNYTGPGQGKKSENVLKSLYMPGGHFLGLSCINSETNIKSCVNLQRICEVGTTMSQRREEIREFTGSDKEKRPLYNYFVPTGLISTDEINGSDFRSMFATMNHKRLLCTNTYDEKTGYPIYDFMYMRPNGFDGALNRKMTSEFNGKVSNVEDESKWMSKQGVRKGEDYDSQEVNNTFTRTLENTNDDYYMFRLGLNDINDDNEQKSKFLFASQTVSLPQYANSYYFYFGLKDGATALDEFNKQFFSVCETRSLFMDTPVMEIDAELDTCKLNANLTVTVKNMDAPATITIKDKTNEKTLVIGENMLGESVMHYTQNGIAFGSYYVKVVDNNNKEIEKFFNVGNGVIDIHYEGRFFEVKTNGETGNTVVTKAKNSESGYIEFLDDITVTNDTSYHGSENGQNYTHSIWNDKDKIGVVIVQSTTNEEEANETAYYVKQGGPNSLNGVEGIPSNITQLTGYSGIVNDKTDDNEDTVRFYLWKANEEYDIYILHYCDTTDDGRQNGKWYATYHGSVFVKGCDGYDLFLGSRYISYSKELTDYNMVNYSWLNNIPNYIDKSDTDKKQWYMRHCLFRQTDDDGESFSNSIIALNDKNKTLGTALFGNPENGLAANEGGMILTGVYYEDYVDYVDTNNGGYYLADESVIPTWGPTGITKNREVFGEMAVDGTIIAADKIATLRGVNITYDSSTEKCTFRGTVSSNKLKNGHGCIARFADGTVVYPTYKDGLFTYYGEAPERSTTISIFPLFYYPVMYRPFYAEMSVVDWVNGRVYYADDGMSGEWVAANDSESCATLIDVHNGITFNKAFSYDSMIHDNTYLDIINSAGTSADSVITFNSSKKLNIHTDIEDDIVLSAETGYISSQWKKDTDNKNDNVRSWSALTQVRVEKEVESFSFEITEGSPDNYTKNSTYKFTEEEINLMKKPNPVELVTIDGFLNNVFPKTINYRLTPIPDECQFASNETVDSSIKFYYVQKDPFLQKSGIIYEKSGGKTLYFYGVYNENAYNKSTKNVVGESVIITAYNDTQAFDWGNYQWELRVPMYQSNDATEKTISKFSNTKKENKVSFGKLPEKIDSVLTDELNNLGVDLKYYYTYVGSTNSLKTRIENVLENAIEVGVNDNSYVTNILNDKGYMNENAALIGVLTTGKDKKGGITAIRVYRGLGRINYKEEGEDMILEFVPYIESPDDCYTQAQLTNGSSGTTFITEGGELTLNLRANVDWEISYSGNTGWLTMVEGTTKGVMSSSFKFRASSNDGVNGSTEDKICWVIAKSTQTVPVYNEETGVSENIPLSAYTTFKQCAKTEECYLVAGNMGTSFPTGGGSLPFSVVSNLDEQWTVTSDSDWLVFNGAKTTSGKGNKELSAKATVNTTVSNKTAKVTISPHTGNGSQTLEFTIDAGQSNLTVSPAFKNFTAAAGEATFNVMSNDTWTVDSNNGFCSVSKINDSSFKVTVSENETETDRTANVTVKTNNGLTSVVSISQEGQVYTNIYITVKKDFKTGAGTNANTWYNVYADVSVADGKPWPSNGAIALSFDYRYNDFLNPVNEQTRRAETNITRAGSFDLFDIGDWSQEEFDNYEGDVITSGQVTNEKLEPNSENYFVGYKIVFNAEEITRL